MWPEKNGKSYRIRDEVAGKKVTIESGFRTKTAAKERITLLTADRLRGDAINPNHSRVPLGPLATQWWEGRKKYLKPNTIRSETSRLECHLIPDLGEHLIGDLEDEPEIVQRWVDEMLAEGLGPKSVHNCHGQLFTFCDWAVEKRIIRSNPCRRTNLPEVVPYEMRFLTEAEAQRLIAETPKRWRPLVRAALGTGARWGELAGLRALRYDAGLARLLILDSLVDAGLILGTPKTRHSRRSMTAPAEVAADLAELVEGKDPLDWIFRQPLGGPPRYNYFRTKVWLPTVERAGLEGLRFHDLRHTHAAWLISSNVSLTAIQRRLGHKSIAVTSDRYGHLLPDVEEDIVDVLNRALTGQTRRGILGGSGGAQMPAHVCACSQVPGQAA